MLRSTRWYSKSVNVGSGVEFVQPEACDQAQKLVWAALGLESSPLTNEIPELGNYLLEVKYHSTLLSCVW